MLLTFGAIEFGIGFSQKGALESVARAGARTGATLADDFNTQADTGIVGENANNDIFVDTVTAVNAALAGSSTPTLNRVYVFRIPHGGGPATDGPATWGGSCSSTFCMSFNYDAVTKQFNPQPIGSGSWPKAQRSVCDTENADKIGVRVEGTFKFLTNLFGGSTIKMKAVSILQLEPTSAC